MRSTPSETKNSTSNTAKIELSTYENSVLLKELNSSKEPGAIWLTPNLLISNPTNSKYKLFDMAEGKICKSLAIPVKENKDLVKNVQKFMGLTRDNVESAQIYVEYNFQHSYHLFPLPTHQFATISDHSIIFWDGQNPHKIDIKGSVENLIPSAERNTFGGYTRSGDDGQCWFFQTDIFPNKNYVIIMANAKQLYFKNLVNDEVFNLDLKTNYNTMKVINNNQILLTKFSNWGGEVNHTAIVVVDLQKKRAKIVETKLLAKSVIDVKIFPLAANMILVMSPVATSSNNRYSFNCYDVSPKGDELSDIKNLAGEATIYTQLQTGEFIFWDQTTLNILDPFTRSILPLKQLNKITDIVVHDRDVLVVTPTQLLRATVPNYIPRVVEKLNERINTAGLQKIVLDYMGLSLNDKPNLLTDHSFLRVKKSENTARTVKPSELSKGASF